MNMAWRMVANPPKNNITAASDFAHDSKLFLRGNHPALARVNEQAAGVHDGADIAELFIFSAAVHV
jgi:hypothetical protein